MFLVQFVCHLRLTGHLMTRPERTLNLPETNSVRQFAKLPQVITHSSHKTSPLANEWPVTNRPAVSVASQLDLAQRMHKLHARPD